MRLVSRRPARRWLEVGGEIDGYTVDGTLDGHGGTEFRYAVRDGDGRAATLIASVSPLAGRRERSGFRALARRRAELRHPAAIPVLRFGEYAEHAYLITGQYPAATFEDVLAAEAPLEPERALELLGPVAEALELAHARGLVHRALDSESLLYDGDRLLLDSFALLSEDELPGWGVLRPASLRYRPPEQLRGEPPSAAGNVYSLAALLVHALTGAPPYEGDRPAVAYAHMAKPPPRVSERAPALAELDAVVEGGMAKEPEARAAHPVALIEAAGRTLGVDAARVAKPQPSSPDAVRRRRGRAATLVAVAAAAACGAGAAVVLDPFGGDPPPARAAEWDRLSERRVELRGQLAGAETSQDQVKAAADLARAYRVAARTEAPRRLTGSARAAAGAYSRLAAAAQANDREAFAKATRAVDAAERALAAAASQSAPR